MHVFVNAPSCALAEQRAWAPCCGCVGCLLFVQCRKRATRVWASVCFPGRGCCCRKGQKGLAPASGHLYLHWDILQARLSCCKHRVRRHHQAQSLGWDTGSMNPRWGRGSLEKSCEPDVPISAIVSVSCLHSRRQHISDLQHLPGQRNISEKLCLKMQKLKLFRSRDPGAFVRETFALAAGEWVEGVLFSAGWQQLRLRTADLHLYAGPGSMRSQLHRINEHKERSYSLWLHRNSECPKAAGGGGLASGFQRQQWCL